MERIRRDMLPIKYNECQETLEAQIEHYEEHLGNLMRDCSELHAKYLDVFPKSSSKVDWGKLLKFWEEYGALIRKLQAIDVKITVPDQIISDSILNVKYRIKRLPF